MPIKKSKKQSLSKRVAFIIGTYEGGTVQENLPLAKYVVAYVKRNLTKRAVDAAYACEDCGSVDPQVHLSNCPVAKSRRN